MKKFFKTLVMAVLCLALVLPMAPFVGEEVQAAAVRVLFRFFSGLQIPDLRVGQHDVPP